MKIKKIKYNTGGYTDGCKTCDYGSSYITNLLIETDNCTMNFEFDTMYNYISESDLMKLLLIEYNDEWALINKFKNIEDIDIEALNIKIQFKM